MIGDIVIGSLYGLIHDANLQYVKGNFAALSYYVLYTYKIAWLSSYRFQYSAVALITRKKNHGLLEL